MGGLLAITPLLSPYLAYLIGMAEVYLVQERPMAAICLFLLGLLPGFVIDGQIYEGVDSLGSAYFTGLAVVGGGYLFGITGCLLGPLIVCILIEIQGCNTSFSKFGGAVHPCTPANAPSAKMSH